MNTAATHEAADRFSVRVLRSRLRPYLYAVMLMSTPGLASALAAECVSTDAGFGSKPISNFVQVLRDPGGRKSVDEIAREFAARSSDIVPGGSFANFRGDDHAAYWLRFCIGTDSLPSSETREDFLLEYPDHRVDEISFLRSRAPAKRKLRRLRAATFARIYNRFTICLRNARRSASGLRI